MTDALQFGAVKRAPDHDRRSLRQVGRQHELETMPAAANAGARQVGAVAVREHASDEFTSDVDIKTNRCIGMFDVLRPAGNAAGTHRVDVAP